MRIIFVRRELFEKRKSPCFWFEKFSQKKETGFRVCCIKTVIFIYLYEFFYTSK